MKILSLPVILLLARTTEAGLVDDIVNALRNAATCGGCHALLVPLKLLAITGDSPFTKSITAVCKTLKAADADVCEGAVGTQAPILAHALRSIDPLGHTATKVCDAIFGLCQPPAVNSWKVPFPKPAPATPKAFVSTGKTPFQVVHFSDIHIDREYTPGSDAKCTKPICCRPYADKVGPVSQSAGAMGEHGCDTTTSLAQNLLRTISANNKFSIFTGDVVEASVWLANRKDTTERLTQFNQELASILQHPVYPAIGNHESAPTNAFPRNTTTKSDVQWLFDLESTGWAPLINATAAAQVARLSGSYSTIVPNTNLRIISINTVYWYKANFWLYDSDRKQPDPNGILAFTIQELQAAEDAGQRAWIVAHMPPGTTDTLRDQSNYYDQIVQRYRNTIAGQFFGHTHQDQFFVAYSDYKKRSAETAVNVQWVAPPITPRGGNPAFKVYDVDPDTYEIMNARVFRTDLSDPEFQKNPRWNLYYDAREAYAPLIGGWPATTSLNPAFWHKLTEAFETNESAFQLYETLRRRGWDPVQCNAECKRVSICDMRSARVENACSVSKPGLNFRRRSVDSDDDGGHTVDECESSGLGAILSQAHTLTSDDLESLREQLREIIQED